MIWWSAFFSHPPSNNDSIPYIASCWNISLIFSGGYGRFSFSHHTITESKPPAKKLVITGKGSRAASVSVPVRYLHSPTSVAYKSDIEHTINLIYSVVEGLKDFGKSQGVG